MSNPEEKVVDLMAALEASFARIKEERAVRKQEPSHGRGPTETERPLPPRKGTTMNNETTAALTCGADESLVLARRSTALVQARSLWQNPDPDPRRIAEAAVVFDHFLAHGVALPADHEA